MFHIKVDFVALSSYGVAGSNRSEVKLRMDLRCLSPPPSLSLFICPCVRACVFGIICIYSVLSLLLSRHPVEGKHVLIIEDIIDTGANICSFPSFVHSHN